VIRVLLASAALAAAAATVTSCGANSASWPTVPAGPTAPVASGGTVTGTESSGDKTKAGGLTHYADCTAADGTAFRVVVSADTEYSLHAGQPCPAGSHVPTVQQEDPELFNEILGALNQPLPYNGGNDGPCGAWSTDTKAHADQAQADWERCMADPQHHH